MFIEHLENALVDAIKSDSLNSVAVLIKIINESPKASLFAINNEGHNFLQIALRCGSVNAFKFLYDSIKNDYRAKRLISMPDNRGSSLFALAVGLNNIEIATTLFNDYETKYSLEESIQAFLKNNNEGNSALHQTVSKTDSAFFDFVVDKIKKTDISSRSTTNKLQSGLSANSISIFSKNACKSGKQILHPIFNQANNNGDTALHLAARAELSSKIADLINCGSNLFQPNNVGETALNTIENALTNDASNPLLVQVFITLQLSKKEELLAHYYKRLTVNRNDMALKGIYFALVGRSFSLTRLTQAYLEFNDEVPVVTGHTAEERIPKGILFSPMIPTAYRDKILFTEFNEGIDRGDLTLETIRGRDEVHLMRFLLEIEALLLDVQVNCKEIEDFQASEHPICNTLLRILKSCEALSSMVAIGLANCAIGIYVVAASHVTLPFVFIIVDLILFAIVLISILAYLICTKIMDCHVTMPDLLSTELSKIEALSHTLNLPEDLNTSLDALREQLTAKDKVTLAEVTPLLDSVQSIIAECKSMGMSDHMARSNDQENDDEEKPLSALQFAM